MPITGPAPLGEISHVIQLAIAPVFLLTAVAALLGVLTNRLGRAVDRRRVLVARRPDLEPAVCTLVDAELDFLERRARLIYAAIFLAVLCALLICLLIALAFVDAFVVYDFSKVVALLFVLAMLGLIGSLSCFLREIFLGVNTARCPI
jgi:hypothetical protein